jgi:hypothetical protein
MKTAMYTDRIPEVAPKTRDRISRSIPEAKCSRKA